jgi:hypothetical protein
MCRVFGVVAAHESRKGTSIALLMYDVQRCACQQRREHDNGDMGVLRTLLERSARYLVPNGDLGCYWTLLDRAMVIITDWESE